MRAPCSSQNWFPEAIPSRRRPACGLRLRPSPGVPRRPQRAPAVGAAGAGFAGAGIPAPAPPPTPPRSLLHTCSLKQDIRLDSAPPRTFFMQ